MHPWMASVPIWRNKLRKIDQFYCFHPLVEVVKHLVHNVDVEDNVLGVRLEGNSCQFGASLEALEDSLRLILKN